MFKEVSVLYHITIETPNRNEKEKKRWVFLRRVTRKHCEIIIEKEDKIARVLFTKERWIWGVTPKVQHFYHTFIEKSLFVYIYWHSGNVKSPFYGLKKPRIYTQVWGFCHWTCSSLSAVVAIASCQRGKWHYNENASMVGLLPCLSDQKAES